VDLVAELATLIGKSTVLAVGRTLGARRAPPGRRAVRRARLALLGSLFAAGASDALAQGVAVPESERLMVNVRFMAGYGVDNSHYDIGFESQGRVGYAIVELSGKISDRFSYRFDFNPVNETQPLPTCGEENFFYPNVPEAFGPDVVCDNDGRMRVDDYRFVALDLINQQGPIRQAYVGYRSGGGLVEGRFGRFILPIGFNWEDAGSYTGKDATHIQRINAEGNFGLMLTLRPSFATVNLAAFLGNGNRFHDYDYFYHVDGSFDTNSAVTALASIDLRPADWFEVRFAQKSGFTGSKVERLPNFYAAKHNDMASVLSVRFRPVPNLAVFGEFASYLWGLTETSAELIGNSDTEGVRKNGYYAGGDFNLPIGSRARIGTTVTFEEIDRDDALIKQLWLENLYGVSMGEKEQTTVMRVYVTFYERVTAAFYRTLLDNPFPWVSGIVPVAGPAAYQGQGNDKWGLVARFSLR
jgi:hypothetical protein